MTQRTQPPGAALGPHAEPVNEALNSLAAGNVMANPFGTKGMGGGTTLGPVLTWGYICGTNVHQEVAD